MAGYTRQSTYANGDIIQASDSNDEFNQLVSVFDISTGHKHDGTAGEGPVIGLIGDPGVATPLNKVVVDDTNNRIGVFVDVSSSTVEQLRFEDGVIVPVTTNDVDLGTSSLQFKDLYLDGTATVDGLVLGASASVTSVDTDLTSVSASDDTLASAKAIKDYVDTQLTAEDLDFQGDSGGALSVDLDSHTFTIAGGTGIDTTGSGQTLTIDIDSTVATLTGTQTLTNKTLTTPVIASISNTGTLTLPTATTTLVGTDTTDTLTNKTIDANGTGNSITNLEVADFTGASIVTEIEGLASSDNDTSLPTTAAVKDYVDTQLTAEDLDVAGDTGTGAIDLDSQSLTVAGTANEIETAASGQTITIGLPNDVTIGNNLTVTGDLTVSGDDITMATNTSGHIMVADGTNYNPVAVSGDVTIDSAGAVTIANDAVETAMVNANVLTGQTAETTIDSANDVVLVYDDSATALRKVTVGNLVSGGGAGISDVVDDTTPQLGGDLDVNGNKITSAANGDIDIEPNGTGNVLLGNFEFDVDQTVGAGQDNYVLTYDNATGHISLEAAAAGGISDVVSDTTPQLGGELDSNGNDIKLADDDNLIIGTDSDALLFHNSGTNRTNLASDSILITNKAGTSSIIDITPSGMEFFWNNDGVFQVVQDGVLVDNFLGIENQGALGMYEATASGSDYIGFKAPSSLTTTTVFTMPNGDGTSGQALTTNGSGTLSWATPSAAGDGDGLAFAIALG